MKTTYTFYVAALSALLWTSCANDGFYYQDEARVRIRGPYEWAIDSDTIMYSFATQPSSVTEQAMSMSLFVMGETVANDRTAIMEVVADKTTATASQYEMPLQVVIPAGKAEVKFDIKLKRTADLQQRSVVLYIRLMATDDFAVGVNEQNHFRIVWNDVLSKPRNWDIELAEFFGTFSIVKYRFIIDTLGIGEFSVNTMSWAELNNYKIRMSNALKAYNEANPGSPMRDENNQLVNF